LKKINYNGELYDGDAKTNGGVRRIEEGRTIPERGSVPDLLIRRIKSKNLGGRWARKKLVKERRELTPIS